MGVLDIPPWLHAYIDKWASRLFLNHWRLKYRVQLTVNDDKDTAACCGSSPNINTAYLDFRADIEDDPDWRTIVIHELLHVAMARVDAFVEEAVITQLSSETQALAIEGYKQRVEEFIDLLAKTLYRVTEASDYPKTEAVRKKRRRERTPAPDGKDA